MTGFVSSITLWHRLGHPRRGKSHLVDGMVSAFSRITVCRVVIWYSGPPFPWAGLPALMLPSALCRPLHPWLTAGLLSADFLSTSVPWPGPTADLGIDKPIGDGRTDLQNLVY